MTLDTPPNTHEQGDRMPAAGGPPHRRAYQERLGGRHATIQDYEFRVIILVFFCFAIYVIRYPPTRRPISREDAHLKYPRYPRVFMFMYLLPTPPLISVRKDGGITVVYLCGF